MTRRLLLILLVCLLLLPSLVCLAGIRAPGKYCGTVIFDRWGGCTLYGGVFVMYISEKVKDQLRPYAGQAIQIDAKEVDQPMNPGDGLIRRLEYLGPAPKERNWIEIDGVSLKSSVEIQNGKPVATILIENTGHAALKLFSQELALTLLTKREGSPKAWSVSDGPSYALITRQSFEIGSDTPRWEGRGVEQGKPYAWTIGKENALPHAFSLMPGEKKTVNVRLDLPDGEYEFLCGYGGGHGEKGVASNLSAFDVVQGKANVRAVTGRQ